MVLKAADELRHPAFLNDDYHWRESLYFNFNDTANQIGGWLYLWVVHNHPTRPFSITLDHAPTC